MKMTKNEVLAKQSIISHIMLKRGNEELSKELKVKVMNMRVILGKVRREFDEDLKEVADEVTILKKRVAELELEIKQLKK